MPVIMPQQQLFTGRQELDDAYVVDGLSAE